MVIHYRLRWVRSGVTKSIDYTTLVEHHRPS
jgi:hypothetical protein